MELVQKVAQKAGQSILPLAKGRGTGRRFAPGRRRIAPGRIGLWRRFCPFPRGLRGFLLGDAGVGPAFVSDIAVIHPSPLPFGKKLPPYMEQPRQLQRPVHFLLPLRLEIRGEGVKESAGVGILAAAQLLNQGQKAGDDLGIQISESRQGIDTVLRWRRR